jgi:hypothetical protein
MVPDDQVAIPQVGHLDPNEGAAAGPAGNDLVGVSAGDTEEPAGKPAS